MTERVIEVVEGPDAGKTFPLPLGVSVIGRDAGVAVELAGDHLVSRRHARLTPREDGLLVEDLESRNGTFVDGNQIYSPAIVMPANEITVGVSVLALRSSSATVVQATRVIPAALTVAHRATPPAVPPPPAAAPPPQPAGYAAPPVHVEAGLAAQERPPDYVPRDIYGTPSASESPLSPLLDKNTKRLARTAPLAIFVIVILVVIIALALR